MPCLRVNTPLWSRADVTLLEDQARVTFGCSVIVPTVTSAPLPQKWVFHRDSFLFLYR
jgi:hypothetical protein